MNQAAGAVVLFGVIAIIFLGFFLIIPQTYTRLNATDLDAIGNATLDDAYGVSMTVQNLSGVLIIATAAFGLTIVVVWALGRRFG